MTKLDSLRMALLDSPLKIEPDDIAVFSDNGKVISMRGDENTHFQLKYTANVLITDYAGNLSEIAYILLPWLDTNMPNRPDEAMRYEADIIDHQKCDVSLSIDIEEYITPETVQNGINLNTCTDKLPDHEAIIVTEMTINEP